MIGSGSIARSFMMMSFLTAALVVGVQSLQNSGKEEARSPLPAPAFTPVPLQWHSARVALQRLTLAQSAIPRSPFPPASIPPASIPPAPIPRQPQMATTPPSPTSPASEPGLVMATVTAEAPPVVPPRSQPSLSLSSLLLAWPGSGSDTPFVPAIAGMQDYVAPLPERVIQVVVDLGDRQTYLYQGTTELARYPVAIGKDGWETPTGRFHVIDMQTDPHWQHPITRADVPPGPNNPLGSRWIAFLPMPDGVIGFHGTYQTELLGQAVSHGCIRMQNADIEALFSHLRVGVPVIVRH